MSENERPDNDRNDKPAERKPQESAEATSSPSQERSLWELFGRGVGKGLQAARQVKDRISSETTEYLNRQDTEERLDNRYRVLGRIVAQQFLEWKNRTVSAEDAGVEKVLEEIRDLEARLEEIERAEASDEESSTGSSGDEGEGGDTSEDAGNGGESQSR